MYNENLNEDARNDRDVEAADNFNQPCEACGFPLNEAGICERCEAAEQFIDWGDEHD